MRFPIKNFRDILFSNWFRVSLVIEMGALKDFGTNQILPWLFYDK